MKKIVLTILVSASIFPAFAQWSNSGFNYTTDRVAIGTSSFTGKRLNVQANEADHVSLMENPHASGYGLVLRATNDPLRIVPVSGSDYLFVVNGNGNTGIGYNSATHKLDVAGTVRGYGDMRITGVGTGNGLYADDGAGSTIFSIVRQASNETRFQSYGFYTFYSGSSTGTEKMRIDANGNVGIGTTTPSGKLDINQAGSQLRLSGGTVAGGVWTSTSDVLYLADWNTGSKGLNINMSTGAINVGTDAGTITGYGANVSFLGASSNGDALWMSRYNNGDNKSELRVNIGDDYGQSEDMFVVGTHHWSGGTWYPHLAVQASGNVGIGTTNTHGFKLAVNGKTITEEVVVQLYGNWPDYVFESDYKLPSLSELEQYIKTNKHLPDVPTADEVKENGLSVGEMNAILLKKVEELTLHLIEANRRIDKQQKQIDELNHNNKRN